MSNNSPAERTGRVVRLHFSCRAKLPMGSFLRVTGSTLWAPNSSATLQTDDDTASAEQAGGRNPVDNSGTSNHTINTMLPRLYASSVEMVTSPEEYPVWRTRKPVVVVIHNPRKNVQHHYYRYLVVSPGNSVNTSRMFKTNSAFHDERSRGGDAISEGDESETTTTDMWMDDQSALIGTSSEIIGSTTVMQWEDPFATIHSTALSALSLNNNNNSNAHSTTASLSSWTGGNSIMDDTSTVGRPSYRNLPYRTVDIDVALGRVMDGDVSMDQWNNSEDLTFRPYQIREAVHEENRRTASMRSNASSIAQMNAVSSANAMELDSLNPANANNTNSGALTPPAFSKNHRLFFICFHLPVVVVQHKTSKVWRASWSESILAKTEGSQILSTYQAYWVGTVTTHPPLKTEEDKEEVRRLLLEMNCMPIFLDHQLRQSHYYGFCKQVLWPAFHNIDLLDLSTCGWLSDQEGLASDWDQSRLDNWWGSYVQVNNAFVDVLAGLVRPNDLLWIHDYHLSLLPQAFQEWEMKKFGCKVTRKVFFLHIPFPTSQIFRELECGERILEGMLHADVVGFHAFDHARHFLNAAKRILGLNYESLVGGLIGVNFQGNTVLVSMSNVSIEPRMVDAALMLPSVKDGSNAIRSKHEKRTIIGGLDIGQRLSGIALKLLAFERLLQDYPVWRNKVVLIQCVLFPGSRQLDEQVTQSECNALVQRIISKFGDAVIDYQEIRGSAMPMDQRLSLWKATDVLMNTPIREGLNHWPMEYIHVHKEPEPAGVVITSEFSANSSILNGALRVNPYDITMTVTTIDKAISMSRQEREGRRYRDIDFVSTSPSDKWVKNVLRDLRDTTLHQTRSSEINSQTSTPHDSQTPMGQELIDSTAAFLARESNQAFTPMSRKALKRAFNASKRRVIITDFNGTIVLKEPPGKYLKREILGTSGNKPPEEVISAIEKLSADDRNVVYVVSGDSEENVMSALGHLPNLGLAVSNGARFSPPLQPGETTRRWYTFDLGVDWDAVDRAATSVLTKYTARSNGSFVKKTSFSIGWSYYSCDPEWGSLQAAHLVLELENVLKAYDVRFVTLKGIVEVVPRKLNKGLIVKKVLRDTAAKSPEGVDFVLCFGDDISDEKMFTSVFSFFAEVGDSSACKPGPAVVRADGTREEDNAQNMYDDNNNQVTAGSTLTVVPDPMYSFTVAVGKKSTHASTYVNDAQDVADALVFLAEGSVPHGGVPVRGGNGASSLFT